MQESKNTRTKERKNRRSLGVALHGIYLGSASHVCAIAQLVVTRNDECEKRRTQEPMISGHCVSCTPCMNSSTIRRHKTDERKNRRMQDSKNLRIEERKNERTRDPKISGLCAPCIS